MSAQAAAATAGAAPPARSSGRELRRFLPHLLAFAALPAAVLLAGELVLQGSGEVWPVDRVITFQRAHADALYLRGVDQVFYAYKYRGLVERRPEIVVAGSSRTMKFRAPMFGERAAASFFNAGGMVNSLRDAAEFAAALPASGGPHLVILGIDAWWLNEQVAPTFRFADEITKGERFEFEDHVLGMRWLIRNPRAFAGEAASLARGTKPLAIGIGARQKGGGFRPDGSYKSPLPAPAPSDPFVDRETPPVIERVATATANFPPASGVSRERLATLGAVLDQFAGKGVLVAGYLPPFSSAVLARLVSDPRHAPFWRDFRGQAADAFRTRQLPYVDASDPSALGMDDRAMSDGMHAEESFHLHVVRALLRDDRVGRALPGAAPAIDAALASPRTNLWEADFGGR